MDIRLHDGINTVYAKIYTEKIRIVSANRTKHQTEYLNELRSSGVTNMFGAGSYLEARFGMSRAHARRVLTEWMRNFDA